MLFILELRCIGVRYRLQNDGSWREIEVGGPLADGDFRSEEAAEITARWFRDRVLEIDGRSWKVNPNACGAGEKSANLEVRVLRDQAPKTPSIAALRACIAGGDSERQNCLVVTVDGEYELRPMPPFAFEAANAEVVMRHEPYLGDAFVGPEAAANDDFLEQEHAASLDQWLRHLKSGDLGIYVDMPSERSLAELEAAIEAVRKAWQPQY